MPSPVILWFRRDLRLIDQPALLAACAEGPVIPLYILDDAAPRQWAMGGASRWWLHHSLADLDRALRERGSRLILRRGSAVEILATLVRTTGAARVHALAHHEPWWRNVERALAGKVDLVRHDGNYLARPGSVQTGGGAPYRIFTPFWRALQERMPPPASLEAPRVIPAPDQWPESESLESWNLLPRQPDWAAGLRAQWQPGEAGAAARLAALAGIASGYADTRDLPSVEGVSRLSPHLHFGEISPAMAWHASGIGEGAEALRRELGWRDYAQNIVHAFPDYGRRNGRAAFDAFPWREGAEAQADLTAWQQGRTGYPIVDAGMRQLWTTGWMHNRVRMIAASFLIKHLLIDWRVGERWFWDTLIDADYASNAVNWQWVAGTGHDSNMFGRIMAPLVQSEKFGAADYIRRWVPELAHLPDEAIHDPDAHVRRPRDYPPKRIEHKAARARALAAQERMKA